MRRKVVLAATTCRVVRVKWRVHFRLLPLPIRGLGASRTVPFLVFTYYALVLDSTPYSIWRVHSLYAAHDVAMVRSTMGVNRIMIAVRSITADSDGRPEDS